MKHKIGVGFLRFIHWTLFYYTTFIILAIDWTTKYESFDFDGGLLVWSFVGYIFMSPVWLSHMGLFHFFHNRFNRKYHPILVSLSISAAIAIIYLLTQIITIRDWVSFWDDKLELALVAFIPSYLYGLTYSLAYPKKLAK